MRIPLNSPGSPVQCPAVTTTAGAIRVPEQRYAGLPATSIMISTTAGCALPSSSPLVMYDGPLGSTAAGAVTERSHDAIVRAPATKARVSTFLFIQTTPMVKECLQNDGLANPRQVGGVS